MGWKHYQAVDHPKREPQIGSGLFGIRLLILHFKFQFSKSIKSSTSHIFINLTYPLRKKYLFPKMPKITQKFTQNRPTVVNEMSREIQRCLKRDRDIGRKAVLSDVKTAFTCTTALTQFQTFIERTEKIMNKETTALYNVVYMECFRDTLVSQGTLALL